MTRDIDALNFLQAEAKKKLEKERETIKSQRDKNIRQIEEKYDDRLIKLQQNLSDAEGELEILQDDLDRVVEEFGEAGPSNTDEEQNIKKRYDEISIGLRTICKTRGIGELKSLLRQQVRKARNAKAFRQKLVSLMRK